MEYFLFITTKFGKFLHFPHIGHSHYGDNYLLDRIFLVLKIFGFLLILFIAIILFEWVKDLIKKPTEQNKNQLLAETDLIRKLNKTYKSQILWTELKKIEPSKEYLLKGNTYPFKDEIKTLGGKWNPNKKAWIMKGNKLKIFLSFHLKELNFLQVKYPYVFLKFKESKTSKKEKGL